MSGQFEKMLDHMKQTFSRNLRVYMAIEGIKQKELAKQCGLSSVTINYYISGRRSPNMESAARLAEVLKIKVEDLFAHKTYH